MSGLSLVMIVKDAARLLAGFLPTHAGLADEVVVVDTGSVDATPRIAAAAGARVLHHPWRDDFAAARNAGLEAAAGSWILILDADEAVAPRDFARLRAACAGPPDGVYLQTVLNYCPCGEHGEWRPLRGLYPAQEAGQSGYFESRRVGLFPKERRLTFQGSVHESVLPAAAALGLAVRDLDVPVHHYGYAAGTARSRERRDLYRRLVEAKVEREPGDWAALLELAGIRLEDGRGTAAEPLLVELSAGPRGLRPVVRGLVLLAGLRREQGRLQEARNLLEEAVAQDPGFLFGWLHWIRLERHEGRLRAAAELLALSRDIWGEGEPLLLKERMGFCIQTGDWRGGVAAAQALAGLCPDWSEVRALQTALTAMSARAGGGKE